MAKNEYLPEIYLKEIVSPLLLWFDQNARVLPWRENPRPYEVWISEIMLQQTRVEAVKPYFDRWVRALPTLEDLAEAPEEQLLLLWQGLGYYNRVRNLKKAAIMILNEFGGQFPAAFSDLLKLPGIGEYTAGAVASIAFQQPVPCVDGNVLRVISRITASDEDIGKPAVKASITEKIRAVIPVDRPGDFNQALMELGAIVCLPNGQPQCASCPISHLCAAYREDKIGQYPVKRKKKARIIDPITVFLIDRDGMTAVRKRNSSGLLSGLWEFPNVEGSISKACVNETLSQWGIVPAEIRRLTKAKHIFTHREWHMTGYFVSAESCDNASHDFIWVKPDSLHQYALPAAFRPYWKIVEEKNQAYSSERNQESD